MKSSYQQRQYGPQQPKPDQYSYTRTTRQRAAGMPRYLSAPAPRLRMRARLTDTGPGTQDAAVTSILNSPVSQPFDKEELRANQLADQLMSNDGLHAASARQSSLDQANQTRHSQQSGSTILGAGSPLPSQALTFFEAGFNQPLDHIRIHTNSSSQLAAERMNARAFVQGNHIGFARGQYDPDSDTGRHLLAHELAHVTEHAQENRIHREVWHVDDHKREVNRQILVQLIFENTWTDWWNDTGWTEARINTFRSDFVRVIEDNFNNNAMLLQPTADANDVLPQKNVDEGYKPTLDIRLVPNDETSVSEDWEVEVESNPSGEDRKSENVLSYGYLDEADNTAVAKKSSAPGVEQIPSVHEFGHFIGLDHPGAGLDDDELSTGANEYGHTGSDAEGRTVDGPNDLMGSGMGHQPFYFDAWKEALEDHIADLRRQKRIDQIINNLLDIQTTGI